MDKKQIFVAAAALMIGAGGGYLGTEYYYKKQINFYNDYSLIHETVETLDEYGVTFEKNDKTDAAIMNGFLSVYNDAYMSYEKDEVGTISSIASQVNRFPIAAGCGFLLSCNDDDELYFSDIVEGLPADKAGAEIGDIILEIDGVRAEDSDYKFPRCFYGDDGTICKVLVRRNGEEKELEIERYNEPNKITDGVSVKLIGDTAYIKIDFYDEMTVGAVSQKMHDIGGFDKLIIDLRNNPGGDIQQSVDTAAVLGAEGYVDLFLSSGSEERFVPFDEIKPEFTFSPKKTVVLVNENTASAAEVMTAILKQFGDAEIVGSNTYGKGIFQRKFMLSNGGIVHYTAGYYTVGTWECYHGKGIAPDHEIEMDFKLVGTDEDIQLDKALEIIG